MWTVQTLPPSQDFFCARCIAQPRSDLKPGSQRRRRALHLNGRFIVQRRNNTKSRVRAQRVYTHTHTHSHTHTRTRVRCVSPVRGRWVTGWALTISVPHSEKNTSPATPNRLCCHSARGVSGVNSPVGRGGGETGGPQVCAGSENALIKSAGPRAMWSRKIRKICPYTCVRTPEY